ncbi:MULTISPECIES: hypothetical protein [unclassified Mycobacterium]|uniref:hypothetical protein n=1 Tax=unclassified Mycobacterium TaxID=2642494 RepID=UPI0012E3A413|nr:MULTISPECIES: hypothetical protein [unclassified Mycobacterium]
MTRIEATILARHTTQRFADNGRVAGRKTLIGVQAEVITDHVAAQPAGRGARRANYASSNGANHLLGAG